MSATTAAAATGQACAACVRRSWLLCELTGPLDRCAADRARLLQLLALPDVTLLQALAGRRAAELTERYERFDACESASRAHVDAICRHARGWPPALSATPNSPHLLDVAGGSERLIALVAAPVVALVGSGSPSDYGVEVAKGIARGLAASGVTVIATLGDGIAGAALAGALDAGGRAIGVVGDGLSVSGAARVRPLRERLRRGGCLVSELPRGCAGRHWGRVAGERTVVAGAGLVVVVEAQDSTRDLFAARLARASGRDVAAVPGRVTSPLSRGAHALLIDGARLVRGPNDVLELLRERDCVRASPHARSADSRPSATHVGEAETQPGATHVGAPASACLQPRLRATLARVGGGWDTPDKLTRTGADHADVLLSLSELELLGLLARGDGGRYVPTVG